jgi:hypothetical protein
MREIPTVIRTATERAISQVLAGLNDMLKNGGYSEPAMLLLCQQAIEGQVDLFNEKAQEYWDLH